MLHGNQTEKESRGGGEISGDRRKWDVSTSKGKYAKVNHVLFIVIRYFILHHTLIKVCSQKKQKKKEKKNGMCVCVWPGVGQCRNGKGQKQMTRK